MKNKIILEFEKPIKEIYTKIEELKSLTENKHDKYFAQGLNQLKEKAEVLKEKVYSNLDPIQIVQISRHPERPFFKDYIDNIFTDYLELHGDRIYGDDQALFGGMATFEDQEVMIIGQQRGKSAKENIKRNFGMPKPEGYRKSLRLMRLAEQFNRPIITFIDTKGAYPGICSEERGIAEAIAMNLREMSGLKVPILSIIIGEGGSGGALGIGVGNKVAILKYAIYSVISPEGCAAILWRDAALAPTAAKKLHLTSDKLLELKIVDEIINEPLTGAHSDHNQTYKNVKKYIKKELKKYIKYDGDKLIEDRYKRFRKLGEFSIQ